MTAPTFQGEVMLAGWGETHNGGAKVTFWLPDPSDLDAFKPLTIAKGKTAGHRFMAVLVEIDENEQPKEPVAAAVDEGKKGGELSKLAGRLCGNISFCEWVFSRNWESKNGPAKTIALNSAADPAELTKATAKLVRLVCGVESRAELDHDTEAAAIFHDRFRKPWAEYNARRA